MSHVTKTFRALGWNAAGTAFRFVLQFGTGIVLARQLGPEAFGIVAAAMVVIALGSLIGESGLGASLIAEEEPRPQDFASIQALQLGISLALTALIASSAGIVARAYEMTALAPVLRVLALQFPIQALNTTGNVLLKRRLDFRAIQLAQVVSYTVGYAVVGMLAVVLGLGVWSLVAAQLTYVTGNTILLIVLGGEPLRLHFRRAPRHIVAYGLRVAGSNLGTWVSTNLDVAAVGRLFGAVLTGLYSRAAALISAPLNLLITLVQGVLFPAFAQARARGSDLASPYLAVCALALVAGTPAAVFVATHATDIVQLLLGSAWLEAAPMLAVLAWTIPLQALTALSVALLWGVGKASADLWGQGAALALFGIALVVRGAESPTTIAVLVVAASVVRAAFTCQQAARSLHFSVARLLPPLLASAAVAVLVAAVPLARARALGAGAGNSGVRLVVDALLAVVVTVPLLLLWPRAVVGRELAELLGRVGAGSASPRLRLLLSHFSTT